MSPRETIYSIFYTLCFFAALAGGVTGTHTAPLAFVVEIIAIPIGLILFFIDAVLSKSTEVHKVGLAANGLLLAFVMLTALL